MGFFSDLKEDLSQAVNELMPEKSWIRQPWKRRRSSRWKIRRRQRKDSDGAAGRRTTNDNAALEEMLKNLDSIEIPQENAEEQPGKRKQRQKNPG